MSDTPEILDAAVQIVEDEHYDTDDERGHAQRVVAALCERGWLHDPAVVAALRAVADAARAFEDSPDDDYSGALRQAMVDALDALSSPAVPAVPPGEDGEPDPDYPDVSGGGVPYLPVAPPAPALPAP